MKKFNDKKIGYTAIVYVMESTKSVIVHFDGFKNIKGSISEGEMNFIKEITPKEIDLKFIAERTGAAVSEEELLKLKALLGKN